MQPSVPRGRSGQVEAAVLGAEGAPSRPTGDARRSSHQAAGLLCPRKLPISFSRESGALVNAAHSSLSWPTEARGLGWVWRPGLHVPGETYGNKEVKLLLLLPAQALRGSPRDEGRGAALGASRCAKEEMLLEGY